jgi:deoxyadenosine/deoxycytidine kinase
MFTWSFLLCSKIVNYIFQVGKIKKKPKLVSIDGNVGSGKSTLISLLKQRYNNIYFAKEPVDIWKSLTDNDGKDILSYFYTDKKRWGYTFQNLAFITRKMELDNAMKSGYDLIITERSTLTDSNIFAKMLYENECLTDIEMNIYKFWLNEYNFKVDKQIYLRTSVDNCLNRIRKRNRVGEEEIDINYLGQLDDKHNDWILDQNQSGETEKLIINGNLNFVDDQKVRKQIFSQIDRFLTV